MIYLLIIFLLYIIISYLIFIIICRVRNHSLLKIIDNNIKKSLITYNDIISNGLKWVENKPKEDIYIKSFDNLKLHGIMIKCKNSKGILLLAHGYRSTKERDIYSSLSEYYNLGFDILVIDQRGCGTSEGKYITFGLNESKDINKWVNYLHKNYPNKSIVLGGISLGATSVLLVNNPHVNCIIADSGFISPWEEINYCIKHYFHIPGIIFLPAINIFTNIISNFDLKKANTINNLKKLNIPILFIHGGDDDFVPCINTDLNYDNYHGPKELLIVDKANHGMSYLVDKNLYISTIKSFLDKYL